MFIQEGPDYLAGETDAHNYIAVWWMMLLYPGSTQRAPEAAWRKPWLSWLYKMYKGYLGSVVSRKRRKMISALFTEFFLHAGSSTDVNSLISRAILCRRFYHCPHFTSEKTDTWNGLSNFSWNHTVSGESQIWAQAARLHGPGSHWDAEFQAEGIWCTEVRRLEMAGGGGGC